MADLTYSVGVDTQGGINSLKQLQAQVDKTSKAFEGFQKILGGLAIGSFIGNSFRMAAALDDVAVASGMALKTVIGFGQAVAANGGSVEGANQSIGRFAKFIEEAASGSADAQNKFSELGVSFTDLQTLSEQDLLRKTIQGLAATEDNAKRTSLGMEILGKSMATVDFKGVNAGLDEFIKKSAPTASAIKSAAEAEEVFNSSIRTFQVELLAALKPISDFVKALDPKAIQAFAETIVNLGKVLVIVTVLTKVSSAVDTMTRAMSGAALSTGGFVKGLSQQGGIIGTFALGLRQVAQAFNLKSAATVKAYTGIGILRQTITSLFGGFAKLLPGVGLVIGAFEILSGVVKAFTGNSIKDWAEQAAKYLGIIDQTSKEKQAAADAALAAEEEAKKKDEEKIRRQVAINEEIAKEKKAAKDALTAYQQQTQEIGNKFDLQTRTMRMSEEQRLVEEETAAAQERYLKAIEPLLARIQEIRDKGKDATAGELQAIPELEAGIRNITKAYQEALPAQQERLNLRIKEMLATKDLAYYAELAEAADKRRKDTDEQINKALLGSSDRIKKAWDDFADRSLSDIERKLKDIQEEEKRVADEARKALAVIYSNADGEIINPEAFARALDQIEQAQNRAVTERQKAARAMYNEQRSFSEGWKKAWREYADAATNASKRAESIFNKAMSGIEDLLVNFAKTGKFEWKSFVSSMAEELLRSQIKQTLASIMDTMSQGGGGIMGTLGNLFGLTGGSAQQRGQTAAQPMYVYDVAGGGVGFGTGGGPLTSGGGIGGGGSIFDTIGNVFGGVVNTVKNVGSTIGNVFGGVVDTVGSIFNGIGSAVGSVFGGGGDSGGGSFLGDIASGIGDLFGGWFANGGTLGAGKWGIAGENGPELISGPANISPMGGTNVTYNINAVDAASFKAMIAADPGFIHAVAMQGGKGVPSRR